MAIPDRVIFQSPTLRLGLFRCRPYEPWFEDTGPISGHLIVFPRTPVCITYAGHQPIVTDPNVVMLYNDRQEYRRSKISERGDLCEWFEFAPQIVLDALRPYDPSVDRHQVTPFTLTHGPSDADSYLLQRAVVEHILGTDQPDRVYVEEALLAVLGKTIHNAYRASGLHPGSARSSVASSASELTYDVKHFLATHFRERITIDQIAQAVYCSPYHLCRIFRQQTGSTIHSYLNQIRLRTALEYLSQGTADLAGLGLELGYSSHSHFTLAFRRAFGSAPSALRQRASTKKIQQLSKILIA
ncbi:MAG TPA: AraC family transcriptional regulator [Herpetosiphonaceae bacterium]